MAQDDRIELSHSFILQVSCATVTPILITFQSTVLKPSLWIDGRKSWLPPLDSNQQPSD